MLKKYGPTVPDGILAKLARAFSELRSMADSGLLAYPYSTREAVSIVRHLQVCGIDVFVVNFILQLIKLTCYVDNFIIYSNFQVTRYHR